jgi:hypothetical protein
MTFLIWLMLSFLGFFHMAVGNYDSASSYLAAAFVVLVMLTRHE